MGSMLGFNEAARNTRGRRFRTAQGWDGRGFLLFNAGLQVGMRGFSDEAVFPVGGDVNTEALSGFAGGEPARFDSTYGFKPGGLFGVGGGLRVRL